MRFQLKNYYKIGRENTKLTQEKAAELLNISIRSLSDYENDKVIPNDDVVMQMVRIYKNKMLGWWHLRNTSDLARESLPDIIELKSDPEIFLQSEFASDEIEVVQNLIKVILADGKITSDEFEDFEKIKELAKRTATRLLSITLYKWNNRKGVWNFIEIACNVGKYRFDYCVKHNINYFNK